MASLSLMFRLSLLSVLLLVFGFAGATGEVGTGLFQYVSRPDLQPPRWKVKVHDQARLAPGHWFLAPYQSPHDEAEPEGWIGPTIYDGSGELIWSGANKFGDKRGAFDFRINNVRGEQLLTFVHADENTAIILNSNLTVREKVRQAANNAGQVDLHEFQFVDSGSEALVIETHVGKAHPECLKESGDNGKCIGVHYEGFKALNTQDWEVKFAWSPENHIGLDEATAGGWDYTHSNSADKTSDGNYLLSCRHTDTIYHIDGTTGEILWRLGGTKSNFKLGKDVKFARQHDIRWRGSEGSRMWISMLDNAKGEDDRGPTREMSRGLRLVLDTENMTAEVDLQIDHPDGSHNWAFRRGNYQVLPNDNIFMGWSEHATQSEHAPDGQLLMEASLEADWLGTYRAYKFEFDGRPATPPDAVSIVSTASNHAETSIYASWNGATGIASWNVYSTDASSEMRTFIAEAAKTGFETKITYPSFAEYLIVQAVDKDSVILGDSSVIKTRVGEDANFTMIAQAIYASLGSFPDDDEENDDHMTVQLGAIVAVAVIGYVCLAAVALSTWRVFPTTWRFLPTTKWGRGGIRDVHHELDEQVADEGGHTEPLLTSSEKDW